ncbi:hypothetical protein SAY86_008442 [Trapa natans]|uniref:Uncharacterized protein n=1 Tax=Trapa natans TaxID=22666 RepID=A0AAN7KCV7_TRANT|nr:hypothetical protein SAY86_008442 [Trapa natans]
MATAQVKLVAAAEAPIWTETMRQKALREERTKVDGGNVVEAKKEKLESGAVSTGGHLGRQAEKNLPEMKDEKNTVV